MLFGPGGRKPLRRGIGPRGYQKKSPCPPKRDCKALAEPSPPTRPCCSTTIQAVEKRGPTKATLLTHRLTVFTPIRVSRAWSPCRAPGLGLEQELVPLTEPERVGTLRSELVLVVPPRLEWALARAMTSWTELLEVP
jgi:hypothetical protein